MLTVLEAIERLDRLANDSNYQETRSVIERFLPGRRVHFGQANWHWSAQANSKRPHYDCQHLDGHRQDQDLWLSFGYPQDLTMWSCLGARVRVDSMAKVADIEKAEKDKMKQKVAKIVKHGIK